MKLPDNLQAVSDRLRVLRDRVVIKRLDYKHEVLYVSGVKMEKGVVVATGYGRRRRQKVRFDKAMGGMSSAGAMYFEDGEEYNEPPQPMKVQVGDVVEFSPRNQFEFTFDPKTGTARPGSSGIGEQLVHVMQGGIYSIDPDESQSAAFLWQQSAGYDRKGNFLSGTDEWQKT